jgi:eukaryotic-like serine/threonine-protein kinase
MSPRKAPPTAATMLATDTAPKGEAVAVLATPDEKGLLVDEGEIGAGGSGSVRKSYDPNLRRIVATKVLSPKLVKSPGNLRRFVEEARLMAVLDHPNIVPVHDLLVDERKTAYFTMKLVRGRTLAAIVEDQSSDSSGISPLHGHVSVFLKVCDALAFAHSRRIIHCDLKPANIMVGEFGEVYLMDWGIASRQPDGTQAPVSTPRRSVRGTPAFMSPEQAEGRVSDVTERTDVFGMGAVLYFILTGRAPFDGKTATQALAHAKAGRYKDSEDAATVPPPPGLARIVRKAMARDPRDRYESVIELRNSVSAVLQSDWSLPTKVFSPGAVIVAEGEWADAAYIIVRGRCEVSKVVDGERRVLRTLQPGEVFGETGILSGNVRTATVVAVDEVTTKMVTRELFRGELGSDTWLGKFVMALADRFRELDTKMAARAGGDGGK